MDPHPPNERDREREKERGGGRNIIFFVTLFRRFPSPRRRTFSAFDSFNCLSLLFLYFSILVRGIRSLCHNYLGLWVWPCEYGCLISSYLVDPLPAISFPSALPAEIFLKRCQMSLKYFPKMWQSKDESQFEFFLETLGPNYEKCSRFKANSEE